MVPSCGLAWAGQSSTRGEGPVQRYLDPIQDATLTVSPVTDRCWAKSCWQSVRRLEVELLPEVGNFELRAAALKALAQAEQLWGMLVEQVWFQCCLLMASVLTWRAALIVQICDNKTMQNPPAASSTADYLHLAWKAGLTFGEATKAAVELHCNVHFLYQQLPTGSSRQLISRA